MKYNIDKLKQRCFSSIEKPLEQMLSCRTMIKVASYCRVSTDKEDQANSFESQQRFFREYIERHPDWELYGVYADEGITGTSTKKRVQFNRMMNDAYAARFKLIITKEVSRFSRNILDTIAYTRELKALGIGVIFMSDGFCTLDPDAELRLSIMGSIAQEESRKTSSRVKWGANPSNGKRRCVRPKPTWL